MLTLGSADTGVTGETISQPHIFLAGNGWNQEQVHDQPDTERDPRHEECDPSQNPEDQLYGARSASPKIKAVNAKTAQENA